MMPSSPFAAMSPSSIKVNRPTARSGERSPGQLDPGTSVVLTSHMQSDGTLDWNVPPGTWQVFAFKEMPTGQHVTGGTGAGTQLVLDHMNRQAFDAYADRVGGTAKQYDGQYFRYVCGQSFATVWDVQAYSLLERQFSSGVPQETRLRPDSVSAHPESVGLQRAIRRLSCLICRSMTSPESTITSARIIGRPSPIL